MGSSLAELRETLGRRYPGAQPLVYRTAGAIRTGIAALDGILPNGGLPRGRLTIWRPGGGATAVLRSAVRRVETEGERSAWVDVSGMVAGEDWPGGLLVRPSSERAGFGCAEEVLRCGGFALVVLSGVGRGLGRVAGRLTHAVREGGGAFVTVGEENALAHLRMASRILPADLQCRPDAFGEPAVIESVRVRVEASALGWSGSISFRLPVLVRSPRLALDPLLVDRRGVPHRAGHWTNGRQHRRESTKIAPVVSNSANVPAPLPAIPDSLAKVRRGA